jgi:hypothetical protein
MYIQSKNQINHTIYNPIVQFVCSTVSYKAQRWKKEFKYPCDGYAKRYKQKQKTRLCSDHNHLQIFDDTTCIHLVTPIELTT